MRPHAHQCRWTCRHGAARAQRMWWHCCGAPGMQPQPWQPSVGRPCAPRRAAQAPSRMLATQSCAHPAHSTGELSNGQHLTAACFLFRCHSALQSNATALMPLLATGRLCQHHSGSWLDLQLHLGGLTGHTFALTLENTKSTAVVLRRPPSRPASRHSLAKRAPSSSTAGVFLGVVAPALPAPYMAKAVKTSSTSRLSAPSPSQSKAGWAAGACAHKHEAPSCQELYSTAGGTEISFI